MEDEPKGIGGCIMGVLELVGLFLVLTWPILLLFSCSR